MAALAPINDRDCGSCFECCIHFGIDALKKYAGQTCKHLDGREPHARCSIYADRPLACAEFQCGWKLGFGGDEDRPDQIGFILTTRIDESGPIAMFTITALNPMMDMRSGKLGASVKACIRQGVKTIQVFNHRTRMGIIWQSGRAVQIRLLKPLNGYSDPRVEVVRDLGKMELAA